MRCTPSDRVARPFGARDHTVAGDRLGVLEASRCPDLVCRRPCVRTATALHSATAPSGARPGISVTSRSRGVSSWDATIRARGRLGGPVRRRRWWGAGMRPGAAVHRAGPCRAATALGAPEAVDEVDPEQRPVGHGRGGRQPCAARRDRRWAPRASLLRRPRPAPCLVPRCRHTDGDFDGGCGEGWPEPGWTTLIAARRRRSVETLSIHAASVGWRTMVDGAAGSQSRPTLVRRSVKSALHEDGGRRRTGRGSSGA